MTKYIAHHGVFLSDGAHKKICEKCLLLLFYCDFKVDLYRQLKKLIRSFQGMCNQRERDSGYIMNTQEHFITSPISCSRRELPAAVCM